MCRAIYPHELADPDFSWLINSFRENNPSYALVDVSNLPMVLIKEYASCYDVADSTKAMLPMALLDNDAEEIGKEE